MRGRNPRRHVALLAVPLAAIGVCIGMLPIPAHALESPPGQRASAQQPAFHLRVEGDLYVGPDGAVIDYRLRDKALTPEIAALVDKQVRGWRFEPILVDGSAVTAKTRLSLELNAIPVAAGYQLRIAGLGFGNPTRRSNNLQPPKYPMAARVRGVEAEVILILSVDGRGHVVKTDVESTSLSGKGPQRVVTQWADMFEDSAKDAARHWSFEMTESVDGETAAVTPVRVPVNYRMEDSRGWRAMVPVERQPGHYIEPGQAGAGTRLANSGPPNDREQPQALESRFKLMNQVIGTTL